MNTLIRTRHPLSGLTLDKEYPPYVSGQFEADVKRALLTPTLASQPRPPLTPYTSGRVCASTSSTPAPPPQWPPHLVQTHGRAEPEHGRAWTYSLGPDPARPPPPPLTPGVNLSLPQPRLGYNAKTGSPTTSGSPSSHAPSPRPSSKTPSARTRSYVDHMASFAGFTSDAPRPIRYWNVTAPATPQPSQSSVASRPAIRDTIRIKPNSRLHPDVPSPNIDSPPLSASLSLSSIASAPLATRDRPEVSSPSRSLPEIQGRYDRGRASVTDNGWTDRTTSRKTSRARKGFCEIKVSYDPFIVLRVELTADQTPAGFLPTRVVSCASRDTEAERGERGVAAWGGTFAVVERRTLRYSQEADTSPNIIQQTRHLSPALRSTYL